MKGRILLLIIFLLTHFNTSLYAKESWQNFLQGIREEAIQQGIRPSIVDAALNGISTPSPRVLRYDKTQPEKRISFLQYRNTRADVNRINLGKKELRKNQYIISRIAKDYGVSECFIISLWGLETSYGHFLGNFPVIHSLATLAYDGRRSAFFRKELFLALHILNDGHVQLKDFKGEWAGASGHPQFLPSSWHDYAVDYDGDGHKDIWKSLPDSFASIANYLYKNGWKRDEPWAIPVSIPYHFDPSLLSLNITKPINQWIQLGVRAESGDLPQHSYEASIIKPDGGPALMVFNNFNVIMHWNHSTYYAGTVGYMAEKICEKPIR